MKEIQETMESSAILNSTMASEDYQETNEETMEQEQVKSNSENDSKSSEYIKDLIKEKQILDSSVFSNASRLLEEEIGKAQKGKGYRDTKGPVDLYRERPIRAVVKVQVPVKEHPRFNFVGKLLGPKGNSLKRLQEETMTKMAILGRGSMRDKQKEEECRSSLDPKYSHLSDDLHVEIAALAPPAEAHARLAYALAEVRKYLVPDANDEIRMEQLREIEAEGGGGGGGGGNMLLRRSSGTITQQQHRTILSRQQSNYSRRPAPSSPGSSMNFEGQFPSPIPPQGQGPKFDVQQFPPPQGNLLPPVPIISRSVPAKAKVLSILDRARIAMEDNYNSAGQYDSIQSEQTPTGYGYDHNGGNGDYYDQGFQEVNQTGRWKGYKSTGIGLGASGGGGTASTGVVVGGGGGGGGPTPRFSSGPRPTPYNRPNK